MSLVTRNLLKLASRSIIIPNAVGCVGNSRYLWNKINTLNVSQNKILSTRKFGTHTEHQQGGDHHEEHHDDHHEEENSKSIFKFTRAEVAKHNTKNDCWVIIHNKVYNLTNFWDDAPCGRFRVVYRAGTDATGAFEAVYHSANARKYMQKFYIGDVVEKMDRIRATTVTMPFPDRL